MMNTLTGEVLDRPIASDPIQADWLDRVRAAAAHYRAAQNAAQDASDGLTSAISAARAAGVPETQILSVITI